MSKTPFENAETVASPIEAWSEAKSIDLPGADSGGTSKSSFRSSSGLGAAARGLVNLVEGRAPQLTSETLNVLRSRLMLASLLFFAGFSVFLLRNLFFEAPPVFFEDAEHTAYVLREGRWMNVLHYAVTALLGVGAWWLCRVKDPSMTSLRLMEYTVFGLIAVFFTLLTHLKFEVAAWLDEGAHLPIIAAPWMLLIFTYALFIPNTWQRSLRFLAPATAVPIGITLMQEQICPGFQRCLANQVNANYVSEQTLILLITLLTAVVGVHTINALRKQAFEAKQLGQYRLKQKIGAGGMGEVYLGEHQMMKRPCAIKVIKPEKAGDPRTLARFEREVRSTAKLSHWNSIDIYDYGNAEDGTFYYVMEYLPGYNTGELVQQAGPLPPARAVYLMDQVCRALSEAHGIGLVHRDLKPANIFCAYRGGEFDVAKLLDFGLAKPAHDSDSSEDGPALTQEGAITGSPLFMSPEQATGEREADIRSDIYSLGCVLYYLLTARPPFEYTKSVKVIVAHASEDPLPLRSHEPDLPLELDEIVLRCMEKDPDDRFQSVEELRDALVRVELEDRWSSELASDWWNCNGCPKRKAMAAAAVEAAAV